MDAALAEAARRSKEKERGKASSATGSVVESPALSIVELPQPSELPSPPGTPDLRAPPDGDSRMESRESEWFFASERPADEAERMSMIHGVKVSGAVEKRTDPLEDSLDLRGDGRDLLDALMEAEKVGNEELSKGERTPLESSDALLDALIAAERVGGEEDAAPEDPFASMLRESAKDRVARELALSTTSTERELAKEQARKAMMSVIAVKAERASSRPAGGGGGASSPRSAQTGVVRASGRPAGAATSPRVPALVIPELPRLTTASPESAAPEAPSGAPNRRFSPRKALPSPPSTSPRELASSPHRSRQLPQPPRESTAPGEDEFPRESLATLIHRTKGLPQPRESSMDDIEEFAPTSSVSPFGSPRTVNPRASVLFIAKALPEPPMDGSSVEKELRQEIAQLKLKLQQALQCKSCGAKMCCAQCGTSVASSPSPVRSPARSPQKSPLSSPRGPSPVPSLSLVAGAARAKSAEASSPRSRSATASEGPAVLRKGTATSPRWARPVTGAPVFFLPHRFIFQLLRYLSPRDRNALRASDVHWDGMCDYFEGVVAERMGAAIKLYEDCKAFRSQVRAAQLYSDAIAQSRACSEFELVELFGPFHVLASLNKLMVQRLRERLIGGVVDGSVWTSFAQFVSARERDMRFLDVVTREVVKRPAVYSHLIVARKEHALPEFAALQIDPLVRLKKLQKSLSEFSDTASTKAEQSVLHEASKLLSWVVGRMADFKHFLTIFQILGNRPASIKVETLRSYDLLLDAVMDEVGHKKPVRLILLNRCWLVCRQKSTSSQWAVIFEGNSMGSSTGFRRCTDDPLIICVQAETKTFVLRAESEEYEAKTTRALATTTYFSALPSLPRSQLLRGERKPLFGRK